MPPCYWGGANSVNAQTDVTTYYVGDLSKIVGGGHSHGDNTVEHKLDQAGWPQGSAWWNDQALPSGWHAFAAPGANGTGESWTAGIGSAGVMMGRTMNLPEGNYTLSFAAFGTTANNASNTTAPAAGDVVAFCTGQDNVDITNTTVHGTNFHNVSFTFDVTSANSTYSFGIRKMSNESYAEWCQIKDVKLILNSTNITPVDNSVTTGWTQTFASEDSKVGDFSANVASIEGNKDGTNFLAPFLQVWRPSGTILSNQTISNTFTPTQTGVYKMSAWVRVYNEAGGSVSGAKIFIGDTEADACTGTEITNGRLGTYTAMADGVAGTPISYGFKIADATMNWISWKDVTFTYYAEMPEEEKTALLAQVPTGKMNADVQTTLNGYKTAFESNASVANYNALSLYIPTAVASVNAYTSINAALSTYNTKRDALDAAGQAAFSLAPYQSKYDNGEYLSYAEAEAELSAAYVVGVKAQTTVNSDMTAAVAGAACATVADFTNWSITGGEGANFELNTWSSESDASGLTVPFIQNWRAAGTPLNDATIRHAAITGLHAGNYKITVFARTFNENNTTVYPKNVAFVAKGDETWSVDMNSGTQAIYNSKSTLCYGTYVAYATLASEGSIEFGFDIKDASANWLAFKNVTLTLVDADEVEAAKLTNAKANLTAALVDAPAVPTANVGTGAFQYNQTEVDALSSVRTEANNMLESSTVTVSEVEAMIATVKALTSPTLNTPASGDVFNVMITTGDDYAFKNNPLTFQADNVSGAFFPQGIGVKAHRAQQITFTQVTGNQYTMSMVNAEGNRVYVRTNATEKGGDGTNVQIRLTTMAENALAIEVKPTNEEGVYQLWNTEANDLLGCQDNPTEKPTGGLYTTGNHSNFTITPAVKPTVNITIDAAVKYATRIFPFKPALPSGVKAYSCEAATDATLTLVEVAAPAANVPYILEAESGCASTDLTGWGTAGAETYTTGWLTGVYTATDAPVASYVLQNNDSKVAFYVVAEGEQPTVGANRCYLTVPATARPAFFFGDDNTTGIEAINALTNGTAEIYNVNGVKVPALQKGMNIVKTANGKTQKILVK